MKQDEVYIGARYVPVFADDPWSDEKEYEALTVVLHEGNSYTSRQHVPIGIDISNGQYWALTGNYAQIPLMSETVRGGAKVGAGLTVTNGALELDGSGDIATAVSDWLDAHPEATTTVQDGSIKAVKLSSELLSVITISQLGKWNDFQRGFYGISAGALNASSIVSICMINYIEKTIASVTCDDGYKMRVQAWDADNNYIGFWDGNTFKTIQPIAYFTTINLLSLYEDYGSYNFKLTLFSSDEETEINTSDAQHIVFNTLIGSNNIVAQINELKDNVWQSLNLTNLFTWEIGSIYGLNGTDYNGIDTAIRTPNNQRVYLNNTIVFSSFNEKNTNIYAFKYNHDTGQYIERFMPNGELSITLEGGYDYRLVAKCNESVSIDDIATYYTDIYVSGNILDAYLKSKMPTIVRDYLIGCMFEKTPITLTKIGVLQGYQSFCIYDSKYYSTDGSYIYEQDSTFELLSTTPLNVGHGNSFQLGNNGNAYISGWDDNNLYVINLNSKTIIDTITLPNLGYTTCAVDDINKIAYIFSRISRPGSDNENYTFTVYDYQNNKILLQKKTTKSFGAMQSCDFIDGKIIVTYGLGNTTIPNGYFICDTNCNILGELIIDTFSTQEPEGIAIERSSKEMYISYLNGSVYKISQQ